MFNCQFIGCESEATTKGIVLVRNADSDGKDKPVEVYSCDKHKKTRGFLECGSED